MNSFIKGIDTIMLCNNIKIMVINTLFMVNKNALEINKLLVIKWFIRSTISTNFRIFTGCLINKVVAK